MSPTPQIKVPRRRYRDIFKGTREANAHFSELFVAMGLQQVSATYIELHWRGQIDGRQLDVWLTNSGKWEVGTTHIKVVLPVTVEALLTVGGTVPPLKRIGMKAFDVPTPSLKSYTHDAEWSKRLLSTSPGSALMQRLENQGCLQFEPRRLVWADEIKARDDGWVTTQLELLSALSIAAEQLPPAIPVPDSVIRRHAGMIALALGVLVMACIIAATIFLLSKV